MQCIQEQLQINLMKQTQLLESNGNLENSMISGANHVDINYIENNNEQSKMLHKRLMLEQQDLIRKFSIIQRQYLMYQQLGFHPIYSAQMHENINGKYFCLLWSIRLKYFMTFAK